MASGNYYGKDGTFYETWNEMRQANAKWEQQERQNNLLKEQNRLIREQQERERIQAKLEENRIAYQQRYEVFESKCQNEIFPLMNQSGIKEPVKYFEKLEELYNSKPTKIEEIPQVNSIAEVRGLINRVRIYKIENYNLFVKHIKEIMKLLNRRVNLYIILTFILETIIFLSLCATGKDSMIFIGIIISLSIIIPIVHNAYRKGIKKNPKFDKVQVVKEVNAIIKNTNNENGKEMREWENKIKKYEEKRLKNFNYLFEIALEKLSQAESELEERKINYMLQFNKYPSDYEEKKKDYFNKQNTNKAKKDGTEIFLDL